MPKRPSSFGSGPQRTTVWKFRSRVGAWFLHEQPQPALAPLIRARYGQHAGRSRIQPDDYAQGHLGERVAEGAASFRSMNETGQREEFESVFNSYRDCIALAAQGVAEDFGHVFEDFGREYSSARQQRISTTPHLSVLQVFGLTTRELRHSDALAWFLREDAEHEQGDLF